MAIQVERVHKLSPGEFRKRYFSPGIPVVITGILDEFPDIRDWSPAYFKEQFGEHRVVYEYHAAEQGGQESPPKNAAGWARGLRYREVTVSEFVDLLDEKEKIDKTGYLANAPIFGIIPKLYREQGRQLRAHLINYMPRFLQMLPSRLQRFFLMRAGFFMGPADSGSHLHFDKVHNFSVQIFGRKKWLLYSPSDASALHYDEKSGLPQYYSPINPEEPDTEKYPRFLSATQYEVILGPGDILFIPFGWWHYVKSLETSISLNFFWAKLSGRPAWLISYYYGYIKKKIASRKRARAMFGS